MRLSLLSLLTLTLAAPALAVDGVVEINQACVSVGCHSGDVAGFPVTLGGSGGTSYRLTSSLDTSPDAAASAIVVTANHVTLDLNGFSIVGPTVCTGSGSTVSCPFATGSGIAGIDDSGLTVHDGTVRGFGDSGIAAGDRAQIRNVVAESNRDDGFQLGKHSIVIASTAHQNGRKGINVGSESVVERCVTSENFSEGIFSAFGSSLIENVASANGTDGIFTVSGSTVSGNSIYENEDDGIEADDGSIVSGNTAYHNGDDGIFVGNGNSVLENSVYDNDGDGIEAGSASRIADNTLLGNQGWALNLNAGATYSGNTIRTFPIPAPLGTVNAGVDMGTNSCNAAVTCP